MTVPYIFLGRSLRSGIRYRSLKKHKFSANEKYWLCNTIAPAPSGCLSPQQVGRNVSFYCNRYSLSRECVKDWLLLQSVQVQHTPGFCISDEMAAVDVTGLVAIISYDSTGRQDFETLEAYNIRWEAFLLNQEIATTARRKLAFKNKQKKLKIKR